MAEPAHIASARELERLAGDLHALAFDVAEPCHCIAKVEQRIAEGERIASRVRAVFRGRG